MNERVSSTWSLLLIGTFHIVFMTHTRADDTQRVCGALQTSIKLSELNLRCGRIGPFAGHFDELRIYDYPLTVDQVHGNFVAGPDKINSVK